MPEVKILGKVGYSNGGTYSPTTTYERLTVVAHDGSSYVSKQTVRNIEPGVSAGWSDYWQLLASKGERGTAGKPFAPLGFYPTLADLQTSITNPSIGDIYGVGANEPYTYYAWDGAQWVNIGILTPNNAVLQLSTLPAATSANIGAVVQYVGETNANYTNGHFYEVVNNAGTYAWQEIVYGDPNSVSYDAQTGRSDADKEQARVNIEAQQETSALTEENALDDNDYIPVYDTSASANRKTPWSNIKSKLNALFVPKTLKVNNKALSEDITLSASDVGASASTHTHGNIANNGSIGTTANLPIFTGVDGALCAVDPAVARHYLGAQSNRNFLDNGYFKGTILYERKGEPYHSVINGEWVFEGNLQEDVVLDSLSYDGLWGQVTVNEIQYVCASASISLGGHTRLVNQRGFAYYYTGDGEDNSMAHYCGNAGNAFDRWKVLGVGRAIIGNHGVSFEIGQYVVLLQAIEDGLAAYLDSKIVTLSVMVEGVVHSMTFTFGSNSITANLFQNLGANCVYNGDIKHWVVSFEASNGFTGTLQAVKLELGSVSTLANDPPPDYGQELGKCQRYFQTFRNQSLRPVYGADCRPVMRTESPSTGTITVGGVTYYTLNSEI